MGHVGHPMKKTQQATSRKTLWHLELIVSFIVFEQSCSIQRRLEKQKTGGTKQRSYHIVANLGPAVDDSLLGADQTIQASHGGACEGEKK